MKAKLTLTMRLEAQVGDRRFVVSEQVPDDVIAKTDKAVMLVMAFDDISCRLYNNLEAFKAAMDATTGQEPPLHTLD